MAAYQFIRRYALRFGVAAAATLAILLGSLAGAGAAFDSYIYFDSIKGSQPDGGIEISSFSWGASNAMNIGSATSGAGAGKVRVHDLTITKNTDSASPNLFQACASGQHFPMVKFVTGGKTITLSDVMLDSCIKKGSRMETCTLSYTSYTVGGSGRSQAIEMRMTPLAPASTPTPKT